MELEKLKIFLVVAELCSISDAADKLYISHSTVSRAVSSLETELGTELIRRTNRCTALTPAGMVLREEAKALLAAAEQAAEKVRSAGEQDTQKELTENGN